MDGGVMESGRDLDFMVARAMGYQPPNNKNDGYFVDEDNKLFFCPNYSTDAADAWQVFEWMRSNYRGEIITVFAYGLPPAIGFKPNLFATQAEAVFQKGTIAHTICEAALWVSSLEYH